MLQTDAASLTPAFITAGVTIFGWYATYLYTKRREDSTRRLELELQFRQRQIEELYGPLHSLIEQIFNVWRVRSNVLETSGPNLTEEQRLQVREFFWQRFFAPLHAEIGALLRTKLYLLEGNNLPASFAQYLQHATQEACQHRLWEELKIDTAKVLGQPWPQTFHEDVHSTLDQLMGIYRAGLSRLGSTRSRST
jgi:hypothetical protein